MFIFRHGDYVYLVTVNLFLFFAYFSRSAFWVKRTSSGWFGCVCGIFIWHPWPQEAGTHKRVKKVGSEKPTGGANELRWQIKVLK